MTDIKKLLETSPEEFETLSSTVKELNAEQEDYLAERLSSSRWNERRRAASILMRAADHDRLYTRFSAVHKESNDDIAYWGIQILGRIHSRDSFNALRLVIKYGERKRKLFAIDVLGNFETELFMPLLLECLKDDSWAVRRRAAELLQRAGEDDPVIVDKLIAALTDDEDQKYWVMRVLGKLLKDKGVQPLTEFYRQGNMRDRFFAVLALGETRAVEAIPPLIEALADESWMIRKQASDLLGLFGKKAVETLKVAVISRSESDVKYWGLQILARILGRDALIFFKGLQKTASDDPDLRTYITIALGGVSGSDAVDLLIDSFDDRNWIIRRQAYEVLLARPREAMERIVFRLDKAFEDDKENICHWSIKFLLKQSDAAIGPLKRLLDIGSTRIKLSVVAVLEEFADLRTADLLITLLDDPAWPIRSQAARALSAMGEDVLPFFEAYFRLHRNISADRWYWTERALENIEKGRNFLVKISANVVIQEPGSETTEAADVEISENENKLSERKKTVSEVKPEATVSKSAGKSYEEVFGVSDEDKAASEAERQLTRIINDIRRTSDEDILILALINISNIEGLSTEAVERALKLIEEYAEGDGHVAHAARKTGAAIGRKYSVPVKWRDAEYELFNDLDSADKEARRKALLKLIDNTKDGASERLLARLAVEDSLDNKVLIIRNLAPFKDEDVAKELGKLTTNPDGRLAMAAEYALNGDSVSADSIIKRMKENKAGESDLMALGLLEPEEIVDALREASGEGAVALLSRIWIPGSAGILRCLAENNDAGESLRIAAIRTAGRSGEMELQDWLERFSASSGDTEIGKAAAEGAAFLKGGRDFMPDLSALKVRLSCKNVASGEEVSSSEERTEMLTKAGRLTFELIRAGAFTNPALQKLVYEIQAAEAAVERRRNKLEKLDMETDSNSSSIMGAFSKIRDTMARKSQITDVEKELEAASVRLFAKIRELGEEVAHEPSARKCGNTELVRLIEALSVGSVDNGSSEE